MRHLRQERLKRSHLDDGGLDSLVLPVLQDGLLEAYLLEGQFAACVIEFLEAVEAIVAVDHDIAGSAGAA